VLRAIVSAITPARIEVRRPTLEDVFVGIVAGTRAGAGSAALRQSLREQDLEEVGR